MRGKCAVDALATLKRTGCGAHGEIHRGQTGLPRGCRAGIRVDSLISRSLLPKMRRPRIVWARLLTPCGSRRRQRSAGAGTSIRRGSLSGRPAPPAIEEVRGSGDKPVSTYASALAKLKRSLPGSSNSSGATRERRPRHIAGRKALEPAATSSSTVEEWMIILSHGGGSAKSQRAPA
jgi:hypothetical protein